MINTHGQVVSIIVLWLTLTTSYAVSVDLTVTELQELESAYILFGDQAEETSSADEFLGRLVAGIQDKNRKVRRRATYLMNLYFDGSSSTLMKLLQLLEPKMFAALSPQARINVVHLITESDESAWNASLARKAKEIVASLAKGLPPGPELSKYFEELSIRVTELPEPSAAVWFFGMIQSHKRETSGQTDVDVFVCQEINSDADYSLIELAHKFAEQLANQGFGRVRLQPWSPEEMRQKNEGNPNMSDLTGYTTVYFDKGHPEEKELSRIEKAINKYLGLPPFRALPNNTAPSSWYLSLFICPQEKK